jgi:hypothetical protein
MPRVAKLFDSAAYVMGQIQQRQAHIGSRAQGHLISFHFLDDGPPLVIRYR